MAAVQGSTARLPVHRDTRLAAADGADIAVRTSEAHGRPDAILIYMNGTAGTAPMFDGMGEALARRGVSSYAITSRTTREGTTKDLGIKAYADDLDRVVQLAAAEHPGVPIAVSGTSLGAVISMYWNATRNDAGRPVVAMSPVVLDRFLPFGDKVRLAGALVSERLGRREVATPMSEGRTMTSNPESRYVREDMSGVKVPAALFADVAKMNAATVAKRGAGGHVQVVMAGADEVANNGVTKAWIRAAVPADHRSVTTLARAPHELSQESHDDRVVDLLEAAAKQSAGR